MTARRELCHTIYNIDIEDIEDGECDCKERVVSYNIDIDIEDIEDGECDCKERVVSMCHTIFIIISQSLICGRCGLPTRTNDR